MQKRKSEYFFEDIPTIAQLTPEKMALKLSELVATETVETTKKSLRIDAGLGFGGEKKKPAWQNTAHVYGYIPPIQAGSSSPITIIHASNMKADKTLKNKRINISLGALRVAEYPGDGMHHILFDFYAQNQLPGNQAENLHFNQVYRAQQGQSAGVFGYPIFIGLNVGSQGVGFKCFTVNVKNDNDEAILKFLDNDVFQAGLKLATTAQPAITPLTGIAIGITKMLANRNKNVAVQDFFMGLDFTEVPFLARLAEGAYIAVQIPETNRVTWDWGEWTYTPGSGLIVNKNDKNALIPYNYIVFSVTKFEENSS